MSGPAMVDPVVHRSGFPRLRPPGPLGTSTSIRAPWPLSGRRVPRSLRVAVATRRTPRNERGRAAVSVRGRAGLLRDGREDPPRLRDALEQLDPAILVDQTRAGGQFPCRARDQHVAAVPERHDASGLVDGQSSDTAGDEFDLSAVDAGPDGQADATDRGADLDRGLHRPGSAVEHRQETVAGGVDLCSAVALEYLSHECPLAVQELIPRSVTDLVQVVGGPGDVRHEHRGQDPLADRRLAPATPATPHQGDHRLVAHDPVVVPGWEGEDVPGLDGEVGAVVHPAVHDPGERETHVVELTARRPDDGPHVRGPAPTGLQLEPPHHQLADSDRGRRSLLQGEGLVRSRHVLRPWPIGVHPGLLRSAGPTRDAGALGARVGWAGENDRGAPATARPGGSERRPWLLVGPGRQRAVRWTAGLGRLRTTRSGTPSSRTGGTAPALPGSSDVRGPGRRAG